MPIRFVLDENLRGRLWRAIQDPNSYGGAGIDAVRVGDPPDLPLGIDDRALLQWAEREHRILVTVDVRTMIAHLKDHGATGGHSPGIFLVRKSSSLNDIVAFLALLTLDDDEAQWTDRVELIP